jgi:hypothetical protein
LFIGKIKGEGQEVVNPDSEAFQHLYQDCQEYFLQYDGNYPGGCFSCN